MPHFNPSTCTRGFAGSPCPSCRQALEADRAIKALESSSIPRRDIFWPVVMSAVGVIVRAVRRG